MTQNFCKCIPPPHPSWKCASAQLKGLPNAVAVIDGTSLIYIHVPKPTYRLFIIVDIGIIFIEFTRFVSLIILIHYALYKRVLCTSKWYTYHAYTEFYTGNRPKPRSTFPKRMIHPRRHDFSNWDPFINTYTRPKINKHVIWKMKLYHAIGILWTVISSAALSSRGKQMKLMNKSKAVYIKFHNLL